VQATATTVSPAALARDMLAVVGYLMRASTPDFFRALSEHELSLTQVKMLNQLDEPEREMPLTEVAETLSLSLPAVSRAIDALQRRGYVERREDERDRRVKRVRITPAGRRVLEGLMELRLNMLQRFTSTMSEQERAALSAALAPLLDRVGR
jgi:DNA-binding MarR family transcriptional regulator